eukprot:TRINITY_DN713_c0_g1_i1.p1 TRINITY_DN713_c0_g1~~TRINITY_DN713_c0_g1_i1.p1  ORF type:complete len:459 (+),score=50.62 TRINITY_DN713_c0_g1_i1:86-1462(+)
MHTRTTQLLLNSPSTFKTVKPFYGTRKRLFFGQHTLVRQNQDQRLNEQDCNNEQYPLTKQTNSYTTKSPHQHLDTSNDPVDHQNSGLNNKLNNKQEQIMAEIQLTAFSNSHEANQNQNGKNNQFNDYYYQILQRFPKVQHAFAYGSGVFHQPDLYDKPSSRADRPMIDFVLVVDDPVAWHTSNIRRHPSEYSFLQFFGARAINYVAEVWGVGVHFNTLVPLNEHQLIKYGVISTKRLCQDLKCWDTLYIAGRMHKPVMHLVEDERVEYDLETNLMYAVTVALLLLPERFRMLDVLRLICSLSYMGDVRLGLAEDSNKVARIVEGSQQELVELYTPVMYGEIGTVAKLEQIEKDVWQQDVSEETRTELLARLPQNVLLEIVEKLKLGVKAQQLDDERIRQYVAIEVINSQGWTDQIRKAITNIVRKSSWRAAFTAFLSAGIIKSIVYVWKKLVKAMKPK